MIRCVRMWTGEDGDSLFEEGSHRARRWGAWRLGRSACRRRSSCRFRRRRSGGSYEWHQDPVPRFVITLAGTLEFETKSGQTFTIRPGDILLAQDNTGSGHKWKLIGDDPWRRAYVVYEAGADLQFKPAAVKEQA